MLHLHSRDCHLRDYPGRLYNLGSREGGGGNWVGIQGKRLLVMLVVAVRHVLNELFGQILRFVEFARIQVTSRFLS